MVHTRICALCGKEFTTSHGRRIYCYDTHHRNCVVCNKQFVITTKEAPVTCSKECAAKWKVMNRKVVTRTCRICGKEFETHQSNQTICNDQHYKTCPICGKDFEVNGDNYFQITCSRECAQVQRERTNFEKYGVSNPSKSEDVKAKKRDTCLRKFGVECTFLDPEIKAKSQQAILDRYGVDSTLKSPEIRERIRQTNIERYGVENVFQSDVIKDRIQDTVRERYGVDYVCQSPEILARREATMLERYGVKNGMQSQEIRAKAEQTCLERYGVKHYLQSEEGKAKVTATMIERYGADNIMKSEEGIARYSAACLMKYGSSWAIGSAEVQSKIRQTNQERYGVSYPFQSEQIQQSIIESFLDRYGVTNPLLSEEVQDKIRQTVRSRYGVDNVLQAPEIRDRIKQTNLQKYGAENVFQSESIKQKSRQTCKDKYGVEYYSQSPQFHDQIRKTALERYGGISPFASDEIRQKSIDSCMEKYGVPYPCMTPQCRNAYNAISKVNRMFASMLEGLEIPYTFEFPVGRKSFDIKVGSVLIEIDPTITHNSYLNIFDKTSSGQDPTYHQLKSQLARDNGYRCIHVWDWDSWDSILSLLIVQEIYYARNCRISRISSKEANDFTAKNHLAGSCRGQDICYGLHHDDELVEVMTFGEPRYNKHYQFELLRLCTKKFVKVIGGASKLFHHFVRDELPDSIISYCDLSKFNGDVYTAIGMKLSHITSPNKIWSKDHNYITHNLLLQRGYDQLFKTDYGKGTSNEQLMIENGWLPVYDCGQAVYEWHASCSDTDTDLLCFENTNS